LVRLSQIEGMDGLTAPDVFRTQRNNVRDNTGMTIDEELSALMDRFFRAVSFDTGGTPAYDRLHDLFTPAGRLINAIGDAPDDTTVAGFIEPRRWRLADHVDGLGRRGVAAARRTRRRGRRRTARRSGRGG
jgi:hypothetical protein